MLLFNLTCWALIIGSATYISYFTGDSLRNRFFNRLEGNAQIVGKLIIGKEEHINAIYYEVMRTYFRQLTTGKDYLIRVGTGEKDVQHQPNLPLPPDFYKETIETGKSKYVASDISYSRLLPFFYSTIVLLEILKPLTILI